LSAARDFRAALRRPPISQDAWFRFNTRPSQGGYARLGIAVSRRTAPRSVDRNRIKRLVRESFRTQQTNIEANDVVVTAKRAAGAGSRETLLRSLEGHWRCLAI